MKNNQRGFIQIPLLLLIVFGTLVATGGGYYAIRHTPQSAQQNTAIKEKNKTAATSTETATDTTSQPSTNNPSDIPFLNTLKQNAGVQETKKPLDLDNYKSASNSENNTDSLGSTPNTSKPDLVAIYGKLLEQLGTDIKDFSVLLESIQSDRERWIKLSEDTADSRLQSLDALAGGITIQDIKQFVVNTSNHYRQEKEGARSIYSSFYKPLEDTIVAQIQKTAAIKDELWNNGIPSDDLQNEVKKLLSENNDQKTRFLSLATKFNDGNYSLENKRSYVFIEILNNIRTLLSSYATALSANQQLLEIEQEARARTLPQTEIRCWATTQYNGGIVNGTAQTSIRCE